ncbi:MAG: SDR family NAD(P)-dependent oxidoreductase [Rhodospirillaceae bacterium]|nr:MAG: SDR family NAD(P)-dependent oxidoreductase [Rhodospirillaceae bacterium]
MADKGAAVVIGAGDALGGAIARRFAKGGLVAVPSRRKIQPLGELVAQIEAQGGRAEGIPCDAREEEAVIEMFDRIEADIGPVELFVFNTGAQHRSSILDMTTRIYRQVWESATLAGFVTGREAARRMAAQGRGTIIFTGATASVRGGANFASFASAKHALRALAQSMARELGPMGVHVGHIIVDGMIDSEAVRTKFPDETDALPDGGMLDPDHIAEAYWAMHTQPKDAWTFEMDIRPSVERW